MLLSFKQRQVRPHNKYDCKKRQNVKQQREHFDLDVFSAKTVLGKIVEMINAES